jgi:hypothetical protein
MSESQGKFFNSKISKVYKYKRLWEYIYVLWNH